MNIHQNSSPQELDCYMLRALESATFYPLCCPVFRLDVLAHEIITHWFIHSRWAAADGRQLLFPQAVPPIKLFTWSVLLYGSWMTQMRGCPWEWWEISATMDKKKTHGASLYEQWTQRYHKGITLLWIYFCQKAANCFVMKDCFLIFWFRSLTDAWWD